MDIDAPPVLVVMLPLDALTYEKAIIFVFGTKLKVFTNSSHGFLLKHSAACHKKIVYVKRRCSKLVDSRHCCRKQDP